MGVFDTVRLRSRPDIEVQVRFPRARQRSFSIGDVVPELCDEKEGFFAGISGGNDPPDYFVTLVRAGRILDVLPITADEFDRIERSEAA